METLKEESGKQAITVAFLSLPGLVRIEEDIPTGNEGERHWRVLGLEAHGRASQMGADDCLSEHALLAVR